MVIRRLTAAFALAGLAALAMVFGAAPAFAHAELTGSNPAKGATIDTAPKQVQLTFNEPVSPKSITVTGPQSVQWTIGEVRVEGPVVTVAVKPVGPAGEYAVNYTVLSDDGDDVTGSVAFTMSGPATPPATTTTPASTSAPAAPGDGGVPAWVWVAVAAAVLIAAGGLVLLRRRGRPGPVDDKAEPAEDAS